ncbi:hypothetical protein E3E12_00740 [Formicincola oecophyllae]|uniref:Copper resistance protein D domain-containing protein n=1 Tax=Formicincola oecophyllae TaxID=2558361 RepID=A0A4Y6U6I8_9PROT|nr:hypothetical protein [Formicincola oecophyllae]QDH12969.2 hypothetical protein E3E12_00740 [Formicincola oecophyllae]
MLLNLIWAAMLTLHVLCISYWVGGAVYCMQLPRITRALEAVPAQAVQLQGYGRFLRGLWHVAPLALFSGAGLVGLMMYRGLNLDWPYHVMGALGVLMFILFVMTAMGPYRAARRAMRPQPASFKAMRRFAVLTVLLGALAITMGGLGQAGL